MTRWKLTLEYEGSAFCGWQRQTHSPSVQQTLEEAIEKFSGEKIEAIAAGRTDTGVHARAQVAHIDLSKTTDADTIRDAVNFHIRPHRVSVLAVERVDENFHARFSAIGRSYRYHIINRRAPPALQLGQALHVPRPLNIEVMQKAADILIGQHDFSTFRAQNCQSKSPIKTLDRLFIERDGENVTIHADAKSFLYHQVRNMTGTLILVGTGQWSTEEFRTAFAAKDRTKGGPTAPPEGLVFWEVRYPPNL